MQKTPGWMEILGPLELGKKKKRDKTQTALAHACCDKQYAVPLY